MVTLPSLPCALALLLCLPASGPGGQEAGAADASKEIRTSIFGAPLVVDGEEVPQSELERYLALGVGMNQAQVAKFGKIIEIELKMREEAGEDLSVYEVSQEEADKKFAREVDDFKLRFPTLDVDTEIGRSFLHADLYRSQLENAMLFDKLFFPEDPDNWPELTKQLIIGEYGADWIDDAKQSYERRKAAAVEHELDYIPEDDPIFVEALKSVVLEGLRDFYRIESDPERLEPGILMSIEGYDVTIDEVFLQVAPYLRSDHVADAKKWMVLTRLLEDYMASYELPDGTKALIPQATFREGFVEEGSSWETTLNSYDMLALQVMGFPSLAAYAHHQRLIDSYERVLQAETDAMARAAGSGVDWSGKVVDDDTLRSSLARTNKITGAAKTDAQVILISAFDFVNNEWKPDGWAWAEKHAKEVKQMLDEGAPWKDTLEHESEFWDPPIPDTGHTPQYGRIFKGTFGGQSQTRNQLLSLLGESEYRIFLDGSSIADHVVFDQERGTIDGPLKGVYGYYITRQMGQTPPVTPLNLNEPVHRDIALQHFVRNAMNIKAHQLLDEALAEGRVKGL